MQAVIASIVRHFLTLIAGGLIADGTITDAQIQVISGGILTVVVLAWSVIEKKFLSKKDDDPKK